MVRFFLIYFCLVIFRVCRFFLCFIRDLFPQKLRLWCCFEITGDTNYLASPIITVRRLLNDPILPPFHHFIDIGCGEGIVGFFVRLTQSKSVILHDNQSYFLWVIRWLKHVFFVSNVTVSNCLHDEYPEKSVFLCVWSSWSDENRYQMMASLAAVFPDDGWLISVSLPVKNPSFVLQKTAEHIFAWGTARVCYYTYA